MFDSIEAWRHRYERRMIAIGKSVAAATLIAGCSWVPDAVNPVEWYKGVADAFSSDERPEIASPRRPEGGFPNVNGSSDAEHKTAATTATAVPSGLNADRGNSKYTDSVRREPAPTKQLAKRQAPPAPAQTQVAQATPVAPAAAEAGGKGSYQPSLDHRMQTARDDGPSTPPKVAPAGPPPRANIPDSVPTRRGVLAEHYQRRLAESAAATNKGDAFTGIPAPRPESSYNLPASAYAVPANAPAGYAGGFGSSEPGYAPAPTRGTRGARGAVVPSGPAATFQVAAVQFAGNSGLTAADRAALKDVARLQKQTGGTVRIVGYPPSGAVSFVGDDDGGAAQARANTVAKALAGMGVPARKLLVAADPAGPGGFDDTGASVSIEY